MTVGTIQPVDLKCLNLGRHEIAAYLGVCLNAVDRLIRAQAFPSFKIEGTRLARAEDVKAYNDSLAEAARQAAGRTLVGAS